MPVAGAFETDEMDVVRAAVAGGLGIGILPIYMVGDALQQGELIPLLRQFQVVPESAIYLGLFTQPHALIARARADRFSGGAVRGLSLRGKWVGEMRFR